MFHRLSKHLEFRQNTLLYFQLSSQCLDILMKHCFLCLIYYLRNIVKKENNVKSELTQYWRTQTTNLLDGLAKINFQTNLSRSKYLTGCSSLQQEVCHWPRKSQRVYWFSVSLEILLFHFQLDWQLVKNSALEQNLLNSLQLTTAYFLHTFNQRPFLHFTMIHPGCSPSIFTKGNMFWRGIIVEGELVEGVLVEHSCVGGLEWCCITGVENIKNHLKLI